MWRNASEEERAPYVAKEKAEREAYKIKRDAWQEEHDEKLEEQNKIQAEQTKEQAQASMVYNNPQQHIAQPSVANQYNYADPMSPIGYNSNMQQQQDLEQQYARHQQQLQQTSRFYSFGTQGYSCKSFVRDFYTVLSYCMFLWLLPTKHRWLSESTCCASVLRATSRCAGT